MCYFLVLAILVKKLVDLDSEQIKISLYLLV